MSANLWHKLKCLGKCLGISLQIALYHKSTCASACKRMCPKLQLKKKLKNMNPNKIYTRSSPFNTRKCFVFVFVFFFGGGGGSTPLHNFQFDFGVYLLLLWARKMYNVRSLWKQTILVWWFFSLFFSLMYIYIVFYNIGIMALYFVGNDLALFKTKT